ncbi:hypothetical protein HZH66_012361 [Vespula vulgaris]|uniref:Uncharacterized protein n=1 Tax=Vespula vulgaris TaxID=7454 RepID=A0A834J8W2_VESVU|nr:hypothetical protein HZH66_012361 [Vespula vulgaris]
MSVLFCERISSFPRGRRFAEKCASSLASRRRWTLKCSRQKTYGSSFLGQLSLLDENREEKGADTRGQHRGKKAELAREKFRALVEIRAV